MEDYPFLIFVQEYQSVCKIGTGFSEAALEEHTASLNKRRLEAARPYYQVHLCPSSFLGFRSFCSCTILYSQVGSVQTPDVWFEPCQAGVG